MHFSEVGAKSSCFVQLRKRAGVIPVLQMQQVLWLCFFDSRLHDSNVSEEMSVSAVMMGFFFLNIDAV